MKHGSRARRCSVVLLTSFLIAATLIAGAPAALASWQAPGFLRSIGGRGEAGIYAWGIQHNPFTNEMLVGDYWNFKIRRYDMQGHLLGSFYRSPSLRKGQPYTISIDPADGDIYVPELSDGSARGYIAHYDKVGNYLGEIHVSASYHVWTTIDSSRNLWIADAHNVTTPKVREYNLDTGAEIRNFGTYGSGPGQLGKELHGVATDATGNVYVADATNLKIHEFTSTGTWIRDIGSPGNALGQFSGDLRGIAIDKTHGWLYVVDADAAEIEKFTLSGTPLAHWGSEGQGVGQFADGGRQVALDAQGNVWVADYGNFRFMDFDPSGILLGTYPDPAQPPLPGGFSQNRDVAVDTATGAVWVADSWDNRFEKFAADGTFLGTWGFRNSHPPYGMDYPRGIAVDPSNGQPWVVSTRDHLIRVYDASATYLRTVGTGLDSTGLNSLRWPMDVEFYGGKAYIADYTSNYVKIFDAASGTELSKISHSNNGVAVDPATGNIYVVSWSTDKVYKYNPSGSSLLSSWGSTGSGNGQFQNPWDIDIVNGIVYVSDAQLARIQAFDLNGTYLGQWGSNGTGAYQFNNPSGITHDAAGNIYVADAGNDRVEVFSPTVPVPSGDGTGPSVTLTTPTSNQVLPAQTVMIAGSLSDNVGIAKAEVAVQNVATSQWWSAKDASWTAAKTWNIGSWAGSPTAATYAFGFVGVVYGTQYSVQAKATDTSGNSAVSTPPVKFSTQGPNANDTIRPTVSISTPTLDQVLPVGPVTVSGIANDDLSGIASAQVAVKNRVTNQWWDPNTSSWGASIKWMSATVASPGALSTTWSIIWSGAAPWAPTTPKRERPMVPATSAQARSSPDSRRPRASPAVPGRSRRVAVVARNGLVREGTALHPARRITIAGPGGAGKTTLARRLGSLLELPVVHLDRIYYSSGWGGMGRAEWDRRQREIVDADRWIVEGNYASPLEPRLWAADLVIYLDLPASLCAIRIVERWWSSLWSQPDDLPFGMRHRLNKRVLWYGLRRRHWPTPEALDRLMSEREDRVVVCRSSTEVRELERSLGHP